MTKLNLLLIFFYVGFLPVTYAQTIIGMGTESPNANAVLELVATNNRQGFLAPRLTTAQRKASSFVSSLTNNDNGLLVFDIEVGQFYYWHEGEWRTGLTKANFSGSGTTWYTGTSSPGNLGANDGDFYINESTGELYKFGGGGFSLIGNIKPTNNANGQKIINVAEPTNGSDAATKAYVDSKSSTVIVESSDNQTLSFDSNNRELSITNGNTITLPALTNTDPTTLSLEKDHMLIGDDNNKAQSVEITGDLSVASDGIITVTHIRKTPIEPTLEPEEGQVLMWINGRWVARNLPSNVSTDDTPEILRGNGPSNNQGKIGDIYISNNGSIYIKTRDNGNNRWNQLEIND